MDDKTIQPLTRFKHFVKRSIVVAHKRVEEEGSSNPISAIVRDRALNVLSYALKLQNIWADTYDLLLVMAPKMEMAGYRSEWLPYLKQGLQLSKEQHDRLAEAELLLAIGYLYRLQSRFNEAHSLLVTSADSFSLCKELQGQARAFNQLAYIAWHQHRYDAAIEWAQNALQQLSNSDPERAMSLSALGLVAFDLGKLQDAEHYHRISLQIRQMNQDQRRAAWSLQNLGDVLRSQGDYPAAITCFEESIKNLERIGDQSYLAIVQMNLGITYYLCSEISNALKLYAMAETIFRRVVDPFNLGKIYTNQGLCYIALQQQDAAVRAFSASVELFQKLGDVSWYLNALDGLGMVYLEQGLYDKALNAFEIVAGKLSEIVNTPAYRILVSKIDVQLEQTKVLKASLGLSDQ